MWLKSQILLLYCIASEVWMAKRLDARRNLTKEPYSLEDSGSAKWNRLKRSLYQGKSCRIRGCCTGRDDDCSFNIASRAAICYCDQFCASGPPGPIDCCADYWDTCENTVEPTRSDEPWPPPASGCTVVYYYFQQTGSCSHELCLRSMHCFWKEITTEAMVVCHVGPGTGVPLTAKNVTGGLDKGIGCYKDGRYYGEGTVIKDNCNSCKCIQSNWKCSNEVCLVRPDLIHHINSGDYGWKADNYTQFWGMTLEEGFRKRLGTLPPSHSLLNMKAIPGSSLPEEKFPEFFAATYAWPDWIHDPLDQRNCGASWAFSTASVAADRITIHSDGQITDNLSVQNLISCDTKNQHGCSGGNIEGAWRYLKTHGVVSYACYPSFWKHHLDSPSENHCYVSSEYGKNHTNGPCPNALEDSNRLYRCGSHYRVSSKETDIMEEIMAKGPVQAIMKVYEDFFLYKEGIYRHSYKAGSKWKTHSVKLLGWGSLPGKNGQKQKFWIAANSWGKYWGENGYFRILRGQNECDIEKLILTTLG